MTYNPSGGGGGTTTNALTFNNGGTGVVSGSTFNGSSAVTVSYNTFGAAKSDGSGASGTWGISISGSAATLTTGRTIGITGDVTWTSPAFDGSGNVTAAATVTRVNGTALSGLATGILKNTTGTGVPSIAVAGDFPTLNQSTTGSAATLTTSRNFSITGGGITAAAVGFNGSAAVALNASIDAASVTLAQMANVATGTVFYRKTALTGSPEVQTLATLKTDLGLSGTNTGDQTITLTGDVTGSGTGSFAATIGANKVTNSQLAQIATATFKGRVTALTGNVEDLTGTQATTLLDTFTSALKGLAPASGGGTTNYLRADGTWAAPPGSGGGFTGGTLTSGLVLAAGTTTLQPLTFQSGTLNTSPAAGVVEYDGNDYFQTVNTTTGRGVIPTTYGYLYTSNGAALGPAIADFFGANSSVQLRAGSTYEIEVLAYFTKTTAGTVVWTWLASSAPDVMISHYVGSAATGFTTTATTTAPITGFAAIQTNTTLAHAATASLTTAVQHAHIIRMRIDTNLATNIRLRVTSSAGTVTPQAGSYYKVQRITTSGTLAA